MPRLPKPGADNGEWGKLLNEYLLQAHNPDGTLKNGSVTAGALAVNALTKEDVGLSNVNNTADVAKPISSAIQTALNTKVDTSDLSSVITTAIEAEQERADEAYAPSLKNYATAAYYPGLDPTGATNCSAAMQAAIDGTPDGGTIVIPAGRYLVSGLTSTGKSMNIEMSGATFIQASDAAILRIKGGYDAPVAITLSEETRTINGVSRKQAKLVFGGSIPASWTLGDIVKIISDDVVLAARPGSGGSESRRGEYGTIYEISGPSTVYLSGPLADTYSTNIRAAKLPNRTCRIYGWRSETPNASLASWTKQQLAVEAFVNPYIIGADIPQGGSQGITCTGLFGGFIQSPTIGYLTNSSGTNQYGYGILDNSCQGLTVLAPVIRNVRHAFTDDTIRVAAGNTDASLYGPSRYATIIAGKAYGTSDTAWDTHAAGERHRFISCQAINCGNGFAFRGKYHRAENCYADGCPVAYRVWDEGSGDLSYGHEIIDCVGINARLEAIAVTPNVATYVAGRLALRVWGGEFSSDLRAFRCDAGDCTLGGGARFVAKNAAIASNTPLVRIARSTAQIDGIVIDASQVTGGSNLSFIGLDNTSASVRGKNVDARAPAGTSGIGRFPFTFTGSGVYALREVDLNYDPTTVAGPGRVMPALGAGNPAAGSRIAYYNSANPAGIAVTN